MILCIRLTLTQLFRAKKKMFYLHSRKLSIISRKKNYPRKRAKYASVWYTSSLNLLMIYKVVERDQRDLVSIRVNNDRINLAHALFIFSLCSWPYRDASCLKFHQIENDLALFTKVFDVFYCCLILPEEPRKVFWHNSLFEMHLK